MKSYSLLLLIAFSANLYAQIDFTRDVYYILMEVCDSPDEIYIKDTRHLMSNSPLGHFEKVDIYDKWENAEYNTIFDGSCGILTNEKYICTWSISGDSLYMDSIQRPLSVETYEPYTYDEVKEIMEQFTGSRFTENNKMFAAWYTGSFYAMTPFKKSDDLWEKFSKISYEAYDETLKREQKNWIKHNLKKLNFVNGILTTTEDFDEILKNQ